MATKVIDIIYRSSEQGAEAVAKSLDSLNAKLESFSHTAEAALAALGIGLGGKEAIEDFGKEEQALKKLSDAIDLVGGNGQAAVPQFEAFGSAIQKMTTVSHDTVFQMAALGASMGKLSGDTLQKAIIAAIGFSASLQDMTPEGAMGLVTRAAEGATERLKRYGIVLADNLTPQQKFNEVLRIGAERFALAEGQTHTLLGGLQQFKNLWGEAINESLGRAVGPLMLQLTQGIEKLLPGVQRVIDLVGTGIGQAAEAVIPYWNSAMTFMAEALDRATFSVINWKETWALATAFVKVEVSELWDLIKYVFTDAIPAAFRATVAELRNVGGAVGDVWKGLLQYLDSFTKRMFGGGGAGAQVNISGTSMSGGGSGGPTPMIPEPPHSIPRIGAAPMAPMGTSLSLLGMETGAEAWLAEKFPALKRFLGDWSHLTEGGGSHGDVASGPDELFKGLAELKESMKRISDAVPQVQWSERTQQLQANLTALMGQVNLDYSRWRAGMPGMPGMPSAGGGGASGSAADAFGPYSPLEAREMRFGGGRYGAAQISGRSADHPVWARRLEAVLVRIESNTNKNNDPAGGDSVMDDFD